MNSHTIDVRFYEELNDFLPRHQRKITFSISFNGNPTVKDIIESAGVPHVEVDLVLVNGVSVGFDYHINHGERLAVYPMFESFDISPIIRLRPLPLRNPTFILDVNLGKCARIMRLLGFDCLYDNTYEDAQIVTLALEQARIILTRDVGLLKNGRVTHGYWVRSTKPSQQILEIIRRCDLKNHLRPFSRCLKCNGYIAHVTRDEIDDRLQPGTRLNYSEFFRCRDCQRVYWQGPHYHKMKRLVEQLMADM
ncbi:Mut7-C ubiquitin/RNAse domain-containing protein [bacterium]|nr:Mut7-C ubiquitin/RNAse domain-containing protein [bacterium]